jgi:hypothetical protein
MLVGPAYGSMERKTIPADQQFAAYDLQTLWDFDVGLLFSILPPFVLLLNGQACMYVHVS